MLTQHVVRCARASLPRFLLLTPAPRPSSEETAEAPEGCTAGQLLAQLCSRHAGLAALSPSLQLALNQRYAPRDAPLAEGDELALIPPISGG